MEELLKNANPELLQVAEGLFVFALTHLAIQANRKIVRPRLKNPTYDKVSLMIEHFASYTTLPMAYNLVWNNLLHLPNKMGGILVWSSR